MLVHVFDNTPHHYHPMRSFFTTQCQISVTQYFYVKQLNTDGVIENPSSDFTYYHSCDQLIELLHRLPRNATIIFHGIFDLHIWRKLMFSSLLKRSACVIWGAELYRHNQSKKTIKQHLIQWFHQLFIRRCKLVIALNQGDATLVSKLLKRAKVVVLPYPLIGVQPTEAKIKSKDQPLTILLGNSAAASNNHLQLLQQIAHWQQADIHIIAPLNYAGNDEYIEQVKSAGQRLFGDKFQAITSMLSKTEYDQLLASVDLTIFGQQRQQGLYVVYTMLLMGKPMFLLSNTSSYVDLSRLGFQLFATEQLAEYSVEQLYDLTTSNLAQNKTLMQEHFTEQALAPKWSALIAEML